MGSKITRALSRTERNSRRNYNSRQVHEIILLMSLSMSSLTIFSEGFIAPNHNHQHLHIYAIFSIFAAFVFNRINSTLYLLMSCLFYLINTFIFPQFHLLYALVTILFMNGLVSMAYNYHFSSEITLVKCSIIFSVYFFIQRISDQCSYNLKVIRSEQSPAFINSMHNLTIRFLFFVLGLLSCILVIGSNAYVRRFRFVPMTIGEQLKQISNTQFLRCFIFGIIYAFLQNVMTSEFWVKSDSSFGVDALTIYEKIVAAILLITLTSVGYQFLCSRFAQNTVNIFKIFTILVFLVVCCLNVLGPHQKSNSFVVSAIDILCLLLMVVLQISVIFFATNSFTSNRLTNLGVITIILMNKVGKNIQLSPHIKILLWILSGCIFLKYCLQKNQEPYKLVRSTIYNNQIPQIQVKTHEQNQLIHEME